MKKIGLLLSGCGVYDGSEIHESVSALLSICNNGAAVVCIAPDMGMTHTINHFTGEESSDKRNVLEEASRIARGDILRLSEVDVEALDALIIPGGFGAAKNLCNYAFKGEECTVDKDVAALITSFADRGKPIGAICIAPVVVSKVLGSRGIEVTIGNDKATAAHIEGFGARHIECSPVDFHFDETSKIVTTPGYMTAQNIGEVAQGIEKLVRKVVEIA